MLKINILKEVSLALSLKDDFKNYTCKLKDISGSNRLIIDGGHNESSSISISNWIKQQNQNVHLVCGMMKDKEHYNFTDILKML